MPLRDGQRSLTVPCFLLVAVVVALAPTAVGCHSCLHAPAVTSSDLAKVQRWWILIGTSPVLEGVDWQEAARDTQMIVLGGDPQLSPRQFPRQTLRLAYLSVGEADPHRQYWSAIRGAPFLIEPDPWWPENVRVDLRDPRWQRILLDEEIPRLLNQGFDGFMFDTIDTAPYLQAKDPSHFAGERQALRDLLRAIRTKFAGVTLLANGTTALVDAAPFVDGFVIEGVFATYDFGRHLYRQTTPQERAWKLARIADAEKIAPRPIFSIDYAEVGDLALTRWAEREATAHGFKPYVGVRDLNTLP